jgi:hypothetical protein
VPVRVRAAAIGPASQNENGPERSRRFRPFVTTIDTVYLFDGTRRISSDVVDDPTEALDIAALLRALFIDRPA